MTLGIVYYIMVAIMDYEEVSCTMYTLLISKMNQGNFTVTLNIIGLQVEYYISFYVTYY